MSQNDATKPTDATETTPAAEAPAEQAKPAQAATQLKDVDLDDLEPVEIKSFA